MYDQERQSKAIECLTKYLQYFKTYFSLVFSLIECHAFPVKFNHVQLENATQKLTNKKFSIAFEGSPFNLWIGQNGKSYIDRFYMRIVEFLEYRLNIFKRPDADQKLSSIMNSFISNLHKFFKNVTSKDIQQDRSRIVIGEIFFEIEGLVKKLIYYMFDHLEKINQKNSVNQEEIKFSRKLINEEILTTFSNLLEQHYKEQEIDNYYTKGDKFSNQIYEDGKIISKSRSKSDFSIENFYSVGSKSLRESKISNSNNYFNVRKLFPNAMQIQIQKTETITKKPTYAQLLSVMDIEDLQVYSRDYIMEELHKKNTINKQMIKKYIQVYKKKHKKHQQRIALSNEPQKSVEMSANSQKNQIFNFQLKSKSELNVAITLDKIPMIPIIKGNSIFSENLKELETLKSQNSPKPLTQGNISNALYLLEEKKDPKCKSQSIRHEITKKSVTLSQNPEFQMNRETFAYREKEKLYFQSLKNKFNFQNKKISKKMDSIRSQNENTVRNINKNSTPGIVETSTDDYRKMFRNNFKKNVAKGSSFLSNKTEDRIKPSNSDIFLKNDMAQGSIQTNMVSLEGSSLSKRMQKRGKLSKFLQNEDLINSAIINDIKKADTKKLEKSPNLSSIGQESSVLVLPKISSNKKQLNLQS